MYVQGRRARSPISLTARHFSHFSSCFFAVLFLSFYLSFDPSCRPATVRGVVLCACVVRRTYPRRGPHLHPRGRGPANSPARGGAQLIDSPLAPARPQNNQRRHADPHSRREPRVLHPPRQVHPPHRVNVPVRDAAARLHGPGRRRHRRPQHELLRDRDQLLQPLFALHSDGDDRAQRLRRRVPHARPLVRARPCSCPTQRSHCHPRAARSSAGIARAGTATPSWASLTPT